MQVKIYNLFIIVSFLFFALFEIFAQNSISQKCQFQNKVNEKNLTDKFNSASIGLGFVTPLGSSLYRIVFTGYANFNLFTPIGLEIGTDIYNEPYYALTTIYAIYVAPTVRAILMNRKINTYLGVGFYYYDDMIMGVVFSIRGEYNLSRYSSIGIGFKHPDFFGAEFSNQPLLIGTIHYCLKF